MVASFMNDNKMMIKSHPNAGEDEKAAKVLNNVAKLVKFMVLNQDVLGRDQKNLYCLSTILESVKDSV